MLNLFAGWVKLAKSRLFTTNLASLTDYVWITEDLNLTSNSTMILD